MINAEINFGMLQNVLLGNVLNSNTIKYSWLEANSLFLSDKPKINVSNDSLVYSGYTDPFSVQVVDTLTKTLLSYQYQIPLRAEKMLIRYSQRDSVQNYLIPQQVIVELFKNDILKILCNLAHQKIEFLSELKIPFEIPEDYVKME